MKAFQFFVITTALAASPLAADDQVRFNRDVRPILSEKCFACHGPDANQREGELRLDRAEDALKKVIVPGKPTKSELIARITSDEPSQQMPPPDSGKSLTTEQIETLRRWIAQGAKYEGHWSFITPKLPQLPAVQNASWVRNPIDRFVLARLEKEKLKPSPEADRATLLRRVTLDLTGLPPTAEEVASFLADKSDAAYEKAVDRLLRSRRYGEHMARYWLDAARYADTNGYQYDLEREQWVWRDWVIHAFNSNMPFDQFTIEQLAGDLLPNATDQQRLATAFHRNHPITIEGGVIDEEYRTEYVIDRVTTTSTVWLGLTMMCGRCHDHKYDPISQREFYQFFAFFNNVPERGNNGFNPRLKIDSPLRSAESERVQQQLAAAEKQLSDLIRKQADAFAAWEKQVTEEASDNWKIVVPEVRRSKGGATLVLQPDQSILATGKNPATEVYELELEAKQPIYAIRVEALKHPSFVGGGAGRASNANFVLSEFQVATTKGDKFSPVKVASATADYSQANYNIANAIDGKIGRGGWAVDGLTKRENRTAVFGLAKPVTAQTKARIQMHFAWGGSHQIGRFRISLASKPLKDTPQDVVVITRKAAEKRTPAEQTRLREYLAERFGDAPLRTAARQVARLRTQSAETQNVPTTMVMAEMPTPRKTHVLMRGEYDKPRDQVTVGTPAALPSMPEGFPRNRLGLARWLVTSDHPLTARVTVNRFWQQLFGVGLVKTAEDFGSQGSWPSHPDLLDWLATEFGGEQAPDNSVGSKWDVKALLKQIVMSATYCQSSRVRPDLLQRDPDNRLLARGPRMRLDAEVIRDSALMASGLLSSRVGGPSVFPYHPKGLWQEINNRPGYSRTYKQDSGDKLYRRSLYTFWKRTVPPPSMAAFDAPQREFCLVRRSRTNTPLQAFVLLHDPQFVEAARHLAVRILNEGGSTTNERLTYGFRLCYSRQANERELQVLTKLVESRLKQYRTDREAAEQLLAVGESSRDQKVDIAELAAWTTIGRVLLNLSEFVTKP